MNNSTLSCELLVAGGGPAGVATALAAARQGIDVILIQNRPVLGGNASSEVRMHIVGANGGQQGIPLVAEARESGLIEEVRLEQCVQNPQRSPSMLDLTLFDLCKREPTLRLLLNTTLVGATVEDQKIIRVQAERQSTEDAFDIEARQFVDATGDGRLGVEAGAGFWHGREAKSEYQESLAVEEADRWTLGSTLLYQARKHDCPMPFKAPSWARKIRKEDLKLRPYGQPGLDLNIEFGFWWVEWGGTLDTIKDNETIRDELLAILLGVWDFIKNDSEVDADSWALEWFGFLPGKRESRRFQCLHTLTQQDVMDSREFPDAIAFGGWPIDQHPPAGVDAPDEPPCDQVKLPYLYDIPLSSCISRDLDNLFFAGRNIGATHVAFASTRVMATCFAMGQGVGTAAAYAIQNKRAVPDLIADPGALKAIQQSLLRQDAFLLGRRNEDPSDLARQAVVSASSEQAGGAAALILSGVTRSTHGSGSPGDREGGAICAPKNRAEASAHRWMSDPEKGLPAWLQLSWKDAVDIREIQLVFDTGLHRLLTLSMADGYTEKMEWGKPQPETVRDYGVHVQNTDGDWEDVLTVRGNYQRRRAHPLDKPMRAKAIRIRVEATNGIDHARILEVRVY